MLGAESDFEYDLGSNARSWCGYVGSVALRHFGSDAVRLHAGVQTQTQTQAAVGGCSGGVVSVAAVTQQARCHKPDASY